MFKYRFREQMSVHRSLVFPSPVRQSPAPIAGFLSAKSSSGRRGLVSSMPMFLQLRDLFQLGCILRPQLFCMFPDGFIQNFLVAAVRAAIVFPVPIAATSGLSTRFLYRISFRMVYLTGRKLENRIFEEAMKFRSCHSFVRS